MISSVSLWPTFITAVVGVAGIVGAVVAARIAARSQTANLLLSLNEERARARSMDKRQAYASFITATHEAYLTITWVYVGGSQGKDDVPISQLYKLRAAMYSRLSEVELVGSEEVISRAQALSRDVTRYFSSLIEDNLIDFNDLPGPRLTMSESSVELEKRLNEAMRADLGVESVDTTEWSALGCLAGILCHIEVKEVIALDAGIYGG